MSARDPLCRHCGKTADEHHAFEPAKMPAGCTCHPGEWRDPDDITPICDAYVGLYSENCLHCEHNKECHR